MTWFRVDDKLPGSRKVLSLPRARRAACMGLWVLAGAWCSSQLTDGLVPAYMVDELAGAAKDAKALEAAGLWHPSSADTCPLDHPDCVRPAGDADGWWFHDWAQCNPSKLDVEAEREAARERMRSARERRRSAADVRPNNPEQSRTTGEVQEQFADVAITRPDPTPIKELKELPRADARAYEAPAGGRDDAARSMALDLVNRYRDALKARRAAEPPRSVVASLVDHCATLLAEGVSTELMSEALLVWHDKGLGAGVLPSVVHEVRTPKRPRRTGNGTGVDLGAAMAAARELEGTS